MPTQNPIQNSAALQYNFIADPNLPAVVRNATSNIVTTQINTANIVATKLTSTNFADVGDVITYATILTNNGNIPASNVTFTDIIPAGTIFLPNTVTINGVPIANANPANGILIGTIERIHHVLSHSKFLYQLFLVQMRLRINRALHSNTHTTHPNQL